MKLNAMIIAGLIGCSFIPHSSFSQTSFATTFAMSKNSFHATTDENGVSDAEANVNSQALSRFHKEYPQASKAVWSNHQTSSSVQFVSSNRNIIETYDHKGHWMSTIKMLPVKYLTYDVVNRTKDEYKKYDIAGAAYINTRTGAGNILWLHSDTDKKVVLVTDDNIEVLPLVDIPAQQ